MKYIVLTVAILAIISTAGFLSLFMAHLVETEIIGSYFDFLMAYQVIISGVFVSSIFTAAIMGMLIDKKLIK